MPELLTDISQAKWYIDAKRAHPYIWHVMETGRAKGICVDDPLHITSLMVVEEINRVIANVRWKNLGSISVWKKLGFHRDRTFTHYCFKGCRHD